MAVRLPLALARRLRRDVARNVRLTRRLFFLASALRRCARALRRFSSQSARPLLRRAVLLSARLVVRRSVRFPATRRLALRLRLRARRDRFDFFFDREATRSEEPRGTVPEPRLRT